MSDAARGERGRRGPWWLTPILVLAVSWPAASAREPPARPNVLIILADAQRAADGRFPATDRHGSAPREDVARYRDRYIEGWDVIRRQRWRRLRDLGIVDCPPAPLDTGLSPRYLQPPVLETLGPGEVPRAVPWNELDDLQRRFQADKMAIHAAMVDRMDREIGRVIDQLQVMAALENTLIVFLLDNGWTMGRTRPS